MKRGVYTSDLIFMADGEKKVCVRRLWNGNYKFWSWAP